MVKLLQGRSAFELEVEFKSEYEFQLPANVLHKKIDNNNNNNRFTEMMSFSVDFCDVELKLKLRLVNLQGRSSALALHNNSTAKQSIHPSICLSIKSSSSSCPLKTAHSFHFHSQVIIPLWPRWAIYIIFELWVQKTHTTIYWRPVWVLAGWLSWHWHCLLAMFITCT